MSGIDQSHSSTIVTGREMSNSDAKLIAIWLFAVAGMILVMIALGGATRLTGSGLSIMEWAPLVGVLPPLTDVEWHRLFDLYQRIPQYDLINRDFGLEGFKHIFWLEWTHRLWGRLIGLVFFGPMLWFWVTGRLSRSMGYRLGGIFILGGLQGAVGWFMVASGFIPDATSVSPYRLVVHLVLALILYGAILWTGLSVLAPLPRNAPNSEVLWLLGKVAIGLLGLTIVAGGFVAGLHAGLAYNTFPLMDGQLPPPGYGDLHPFVRNLTENIALVQFDHRLLATLTVLTTVATLAVGHFRQRPRAVRRALIAVGVIAGGQYCLGIATLLWVVPVGLAVMHQIGAILLLTANLILLHTLREQPWTVERDHSHH